MKAPKPSELGLLRVSYVRRLDAIIERLDEDLSPALRRERDRLSRTVNAIDVKLVEDEAKSSHLLTTFDSPI
jgi:hypothetical protein